MSTTWRDSFSQAWRYWEPRRILYNAVLVAVSIFWFGLAWKHFRPALNPGNIFRLLGLALIANVLYCAAYIVDIPLQLSNLSTFWTRHRWALWMIATVFAMLLTSYWINDEIFPTIH
jgi:hypothetical protein